MYDETMTQPCKYGFAEHQGEQICIVCGEILNPEGENNQT